MVEYHCDLCSFTTIRKAHYDRHCKTKKHLAKENELKVEKNENDSQMTPTDSQMTPNDSEINKHQCNFCLKIFSKNSNLHRHIKICKKKNLKEKIITTDSQNDSKCQPNVSQMSAKCQPCVSQMSAIDEGKPQCDFCLKYFTTRQAKFKHLKICKVKKEEDEKSQDNNMQIELLIEENKELKENKGIVIQNNHNYITTNYLNVNFQNMQTIEDFLENLKNKYQLSIVDRKCLLNTFNECGIDAFAETFSIIMKKYQSEQVEQGILPTLPIVCTDGNLRSMKEYHKNGWKTTHSDSNIDKMIDISNDQIYDSENTMVYLSTKDRKKIHNRIKKDNTLINLEEIKTNYLSRTGNIANLELSDNNYKLNDKIEEKDLPEVLNTNQDFSIINDDFIEKFSKI